jgi:hypothetical protein
MIRKRIFCLFRKKVKMKNLIKIAALLALAGLLLGCNISTTPATPLAEQPGPVGTPVSFSNVNLVIPAGLASNVTAQNTTDTAYPWIYSDESMPEHVVIDLTGYALPDRIGTIIVFKADEFAAYSAVDQKTVTALQGLSAQAVPPFPEDLLSNFYAQAQGISTANGHGLRYLHQIMQAFAPITNSELFYYYLGLTEDGKYFIEALLPVHATFLVADGSNEAILPQEGIPFPGVPLETSVWDAYLQAVKDKLDASGPDVFTPSLTMLDALINSIEVTP